MTKQLISEIDSLFLAEAETATENADSPEGERPAPGHRAYASQQSAAEAASERAGGPAMTPERQAAIDELMSARAAILAKIDPGLRTELRAVAESKLDRQAEAALADEPTPPDPPVADDDGPETGGGQT